MVTSLGHITSFYTNRDQTSSDRLSTNFKFQRNISTLTKLKLENWPILTSGFWPQLNFITKPSISSKIMTKLQLQNLAWTSTSKSWTNLETLSSKSEQKLNFMTKVHLPNLHQTVVDTFLIINLNNSNNFNKFWVAIFTCQSHINQVY